MDCTVHPDVKHNGQKALSAKVHHEITAQQDNWLTASFTTTHELSSAGYWAHHTIEHAHTIHKYV